ncbi:MAG: hypothetical protein AAFU53_20850 [Cyanobacteria bacterium J06632_3]
MPFCKLAHRRFPGVLIQGDTLFTLYCLLEKTLSELKAKTPADDDESVVVELEERLEGLKFTLESYEEALTAHGYQIPYVRSETSE